MALVLLLAPLLTGFVRKVKARLLRRRGLAAPALSRPLAAAAQGGGAGRKRVLAVPHRPYLIFAATWVAAALVPTFATGLKFSWTADLIAIIALLASARFFLALAGMDIGTSFGGIGSSREVMIASLAEPAMLHDHLHPGAGRRLHPAVDHRRIHGSPEVGLRVSLGLALIALIIVAIAENARIPVDNPATHLELTMVHEAMVLEYSGRHLAMIEFAASLKLLLYISLIACVFLPWGLAPAGAGSGPTWWVSSPMSPSSPLSASCSPCSRRRSPRCASSACRSSSVQRSCSACSARLLLFVSRRL
jgi:formate hydrogenlyase subunit 4